MPHSHRPGKYTSHLTGKPYSYTLTGKRSRESKAAAMAKMEADHLAITQAAEQRHGRPLSLRELRDGVSEPDTRTIRERVEAEVKFTKHPDEPANPYSARIAELEAKLRHTSRKQDRSSIERKLSALKEASDKHDEKAASQKAWNEMMASAEVGQQVKHAETYLERLLLDPGAPEGLLIAARNRLAKLKATGDVAGYMEQCRAADAVTEQANRARQGELNAELDRIRKEFGVETGLGEATNGMIDPELLGPDGTAPQ